MRKTRLALPLLLALAALAGSLVPAAEARRAPCIPGLKKPTCRVWTAKAMTVADGDTVNVRIRQDGRWSERTDIRLLGVQAMELTDYSRAHGRRGECHAVAAAERLEFLLQGRRVKRRKIRLAAFSASSRTAGARGRLRRGIAFRANGRWRDAGAVLMREGHALWDPNGKEWAWNRRYAKLAGRAARDGKRLWNPEACGRGPEPAAALRLRVRWDAEGRDGENVNGEWIRIRNVDPAKDVSLRRWWVRDSALRRFTFPRGTVVPAGGSIRLRVGRGTADANTFFWGQPDPVFENVKRGRRGIGDGAYLFDPQGDLRAWQMYPCRGACSGPPRA
jgi:micrococcal nuclease